MRVKGLEPSHREAPDPKSGVSTNFTTPAEICFPRLRECKYTYILVISNNYLKKIDVFFHISISYYSLYLHPNQLMN